MRVDFAFGKTGLLVDLPMEFRYRVLAPRSAHPLAEPVAAVEAALDSPIGAAPLEQLARGRQSAAISVCDITRPAPNRLVLPPVLERLEKAGIPREGITILIATGLHRPATETEIREICGDGIAARYRVVNHDARRNLPSIGTSARRSPEPRFIWMNDSCPPICTSPWDSLSRT